MEPLPELVRGEEWHLGAEPETVDHDAPEAVSPQPHTSDERLEKPVAVITVERLAWVLIALWTLITRIIAVDGRPLSASEAANGLVGFDLAYRTSEAAAAGFHPTSSGWIHLLQAGIFALLGAGDFTARILYAFSGIVLVGMTFELRRHIGRAGAIGTGALLALSPTITWFSRSGSFSIVSAAAASVILVVFLALCQRPSRRRAGFLGIAGGLLIASGAIGMMLALSMIVSIVLLGLGLFFVTDNAWLRTRVWLVRYRGHIAIVVLAAVASWVASQSALRLPLVGLKESAAPLMTLRLPRIYNSELRSALIPFGFNEFNLVLLSLVGIAVVIALRVRTRLAAFALLWVIVSLALYLALTNRSAGAILIVVLPFAILSGIVLNYLHLTRIWNYARYPLALVALLTLYVQVATNFIHADPDSSEATWARHANLYWGDDATTVQTKDQTRAIGKQVAPDNRTVAHEGMWPAALRWYFRDLRAIPNEELASVVVGTTGKSDFDPNRSMTFDYTEGWSPDINTLDRKSAMRFFFFQRAWSPLTTQSVAIEVRNQEQAAPTLILPPPGK